MTRNLTLFKRAIKYTSWLVDRFYAGRPKDKKVYKALKAAHEALYTAYNEADRVNKV